MLLLGEARLDVLQRLMIVDLVLLEAEASASFSFVSLQVEGPAAVQVGASSELGRSLWFALSVARPKSVAVANLVSVPKPNGIGGH